MVLSLVDNRRFRRLSYAVLDHPPSEADVRRLLEHLQAALERHGLRVRGVTTDGSWLYPGPLAQVFGPVPHQLCRFHLIKELTRQVLHALARTRKALADTVPELPRGRPTAATAALVRRGKQLRQQVADLFEQRYLFVKRRLSPAQGKRLRRVTRGQPGLRWLRQIMDQLYGLFDRRCRSGTARAKLARLRQQLDCLPELAATLRTVYSVKLEQALTFLDDKLLPSTSNAVERANRRHRKMQKTIYRVRTHPTLRGRIALDLQREAQASGRAKTLATLHRARAP